MIRSLSARLLAGWQSGPACLLVIGAMFVLGGGLFVAVGVVWPFTQAQMARGWVEQPCRILASEVKRFSDSDGTTYGVEVRYEYTINDRRYEGNRADFAQFHDDNRGEKQRIVNAYPAGSEAVCWVDPDEPSRSVLNRDFQFKPFLTLFLLTFPAVGLGVMYVSIRRLRTAAKVPELRVPALKMMVSAPPKGVGRARGVVVLTSNDHVSPVGLAVTSIVWNGIVWTVAFVMLRKSQGLEIGLWVGVGIFALIGLLLLYLAFRGALESTVPQPSLRLDADRLYPGGSVDLQWDFGGDMGGTTRLKLTLIGRESATYRQGTDTVTDKSIFARLPVVDTSSPMHMQRGMVRVPVSPETMHTFFSPNNEVQWLIRLEQEIPNWPDVTREYPVVMNLPAPALRADEVSHA